MFLRTCPPTRCALTVDRFYRPEAFPNDLRRVEYLFALYEQLTAPLVAAARPARKGRRVQTPA